MTDIAHYQYIDPQVLTDLMTFWGWGFGIAFIFILILAVRSR